MYMQTKKIGQSIQILSFKAGSITSIKVLKQEKKDSNHQNLNPKLLWKVVGKDNCISIPWQGTKLT